MLENLHICDFFTNFAADFAKYALQKTQSVVFNWEYIPRKSKKYQYKS